MSMSADVRAWLATQDQPRTVVEIEAALPQYDAGKLARNVHRMWRDGLLTRSGVCRSYAFGIGRPPVKRPRTPRDELLRRKAERERARVRRRIAEGQGRSLAQWRAELAARAAANKVRREAEQAAAKAQRQRDREAERAAREAAREAARRAPKPPRPKPAPKPRPVRERVHVAPAPAPVVFESVEDFMARGGKVQKLDPGACSKPLKRIGAFTITRRKAA